MRIDRLEKLITLLKTDAANPTGVKFDLRVWSVPSASWEIGNPNYGAPYTQHNTKTIPIDCGTVACALGLAAISGVFKDEGLNFIFTRVGLLIPIYGLNQGYGAAQKFFEIKSASDVNKIFNSEYYTEKKGHEAELEVAARIKQLIADGNLDNISLTND